MLPASSPLRSEKDKLGECGFFFVFGEPALKGCLKLDLSKKLPHKLLHLRLVGSKLSRIIKVQFFNTARGFPTNQRSGRGGSATRFAR